MSFDTVDLLTGNVFQVTWDLGRRCNYNCSYCPPHRHDNFSQHATLEQLTKNVDFVLDYIDLYMQYRSNKTSSICFTGGEPTTNPQFIPFIQYLKTTYEHRYKEKWATSVTLTSNGAMSENMAQAVMENLSFATISYHSEATKGSKKNVKERIIQFAKHGPDFNFGISVNIMFHANYFDECVDLCLFLEENKIHFVPRIIGEEPESKSSFAHQYTESQLTWMKNYWASKNQKLNANSSPQVKTKPDTLTSPSTNEKKTLGLEIGRPCCGSRIMCLSSQGVSRKSKFVDFREFMGWYCSVNWFFLHLEQQTDSVFHHQTCQALFERRRGPVGKISEGSQILKDLKYNLENKKMATIVCPKKTCGCGLCAPKSNDWSNYLNVINTHFDSTILLENSSNSAAITI